MDLCIPFDSKVFTLLEVNVWVMEDWSNQSQIEHSCIPGCIDDERPT